MWADEALKVPYNQLPEAEKEKDRRLIAVILLWNDQWPVPAVAELLLQGMRNLESIEQE